VSIYYHCYACTHEWIGYLECPSCGNRELKGPSRIDGGSQPRNVVEEATIIAYRAACTCCDTRGDDPWCPACYTKQGSSV